jgi:hypothetical protein
MFNAYHSTQIELHVVEVQCNRGELLYRVEAKGVAGVRAWNSLGRFVRRGEKGILILAPGPKESQNPRRDHR